MIRAIRSRFSPATALSVVALVFAMTGGAFAVTGHGAGLGASAAKSKPKPKGKPGPRGPAGPKGATGAAGATGPAGPAGPTGATGPAGSTGATGPAGTAGAAGTPGTNGKDGESVVSAVLGPEEGGCVEGGAKFTVGGKETTACNGEKGEAAPNGGLPKTLPAGATETGTFAARFEKEGDISEPLSFPIPLPVTLPDPPTYVTLEQQEDHTAPAECSGSAAAPTAEKDKMCVYEGFAQKPEGEHIELQSTGFFPPTGPGKGYYVGTAGGVLFIEYGGSEEPAFLFGSWAVTAP
jgi:hypothetical protein